MKIFVFLRLNLQRVFFLFFTVLQTLAGNRKSVYKHMLTKKHVGQCADVKAGEKGREVGEGREERGREEKRKGEEISEEKEGIEEKKSEVK